MIDYPFNVNDFDLRQKFLEKHFLNAVSGISKDAKALWGNMNAQEMVEHLLWSFEISNGTIKIICKVPGNLLERMKKFLYHNNTTPYNFKNPSLGEVPPPLRFPGIPETITVLEEELKKFLENFIKDPKGIYVHPIFGPITLEEWHRSHFKHCYHHLLQFELIKQPDVNS